MNRRTRIAARPDRGLLLRPPLVRASAPFSGSLLIGGSAAAAAPPATDPNFANVVFLAGFDASIVDECATPHTLTAVGNAARDTSVTKFGAGSLIMDGSGDRVTAADSADWDFGSGDFTVEGWWYFSTKQTNQALIGQWDNAGSFGNDAWYFYLNGSALTLTYLVSSTDVHVGADFTPTLNQWYYLGATRSGNTVTVRANGSLIATTTRGSTETINNSTAKLIIGAIGDTGVFSTYDFNGRMDEIRVTKGVARDISVVPTAAFPRS